MLPSECLFLAVISFPAGQYMDTQSSADMNYKVKVTTRRACGFRTCKPIKIALYYNLGALAGPEDAHKFL